MADEIIDIATGKSEPQDEIYDIGTGQLSQPTQQESNVYDKFMSGVKGQLGKAFIPNQEGGMNQLPITDMNMTHANSLPNIIRGAAGAGLNRVMGTEKIENPALRMAAELPANVATDPIGMIMGAKLAGVKGVEPIVNQITDTVDNSVGKFGSKLGNTPVVQGLKNTSKNGYTNFWNKSLNALDEQMSSKGKEFDSVIQDLSSKSPNKVKLDKAALDIMDQSENSPQITSILRRVPKLKNLVEGNIPSEMTLADSQELYKDIGSSISRGKLAGQNLTPADIPVLKYTRNAIRRAQIESLPDEMASEFADARSTFGKNAEDYKLLRKEFNTPKKFVQTVKTHLDANPILQQKMSEFLPDTANELKMANFVHRAKSATIKAGVGLATEEFLRSRFK